MTSQKNLLIIDDDTHLHEYIHTRAQKHHYAVQTLSDPLQFPEAYRQFKPDLIILDLEMPNVDGIELLRFLKNESCLCAIALTSGLDDNIIAAAHHIGELHGLQMVPPLKKPIQEEALINLLQKTEKLVQLPAQKISQAIIEQELILHYQPKQALKDLSLLGAEIFVHWVKNHDSQFYLEDLIHNTESKEMIKMITLFAFENALKEWRSLQQKNPNFTLSINLSAKLLTDLRLPDEFEILTQRYTINPANICFEISESAAMAQPLQTIDILTRFRMKRFKLALDDFGSGFSSLAVLYHMPFNEIKVNKSLIKNSTTDAKVSSIVQNIVALGRKMGFKVTADGIDSQGAFNLLKNFECDYAQGFFIAQPMSIKAFREWQIKKPLVA